MGPNKGQQLEKKVPVANTTGTKWDMMISLQCKLRWKSSEMWHCVNGNSSCRHFGQPYCVHLQGQADKLTVQWHSITSSTPGTVPWFWTETSPHLQECWQHNKPQCLTLVAGANLQLQEQLVQTVQFQQGQEVQSMNYMLFMHFIQVCLQVPPFEAICQLSEDLCHLKHKPH